MTSGICPVQWHILTKLLPILLHQKEQDSKRMDCDLQNVLSLLSGGKPRSLTFSGGAGKATRLSILSSSSSSQKSFSELDEL